MKIITVRNLKILLNDLDDNTFVVVPSLDHSYEYANIKPDSAIMNPKIGFISEDHKDPLYVDEHRVNVLVISNG